MAITSLYLYSVAQNPEGSSVLKQYLTSAATLLSSQPNVTISACLMRLLPSSSVAVRLLWVVPMSKTLLAAAHPTCCRAANPPAGLSWWALTSYSHSWRCCWRASDSLADDWGGNSSVIESGVESPRFLCHSTNWQRFCWAQRKSLWRQIELCLYLFCGLVLVFLNWKNKG